MGVEHGFGMPEGEMSFSKPTVEEDHIEGRVEDQSENKVVAGRSAIFEVTVGQNELVFVESIDEKAGTATICPDITDHSSVMVVPMEALNPVPKIEIPEELR